ncbi:GIY-YIG nuclease family protein [Nicoliella spurrieriana]|uniref:GIY-YIG nuclease family protein n=1 Tax=Nicoliella spurrieriana TaxID=2925830 RepID=A0A976X5E1_9LACO|nr:GIY-YIG nuclease family protein [Nicoliella spurrieriana]UQS86492.1 GIY-YIG nuclease family protein [Nicoliella spurrieriana]
MENNAEKFYMYVLRCGDGSFYGGYTNNLAHRIAQHQNGTGAKYTRSHEPVELIYYESFLTKKAALQAEYAFKHQSRAAKEQYLKKHNVKLN